MASPGVIVISGSGAYVDEWHDFAATSARLATIIEPWGTPSS